MARERTERMPCRVGSGVASWKELLESRVGFDAICPFETV